MRRTVAILLVSLGCASGPGYFGPSDVPTTTTAPRHQYRGFSIAPPRGSGWFLLGSEQRPDAAIFRRTLFTRTHTLIAEAYAIPLPHERLPFEQAAAPRGLDDPERFDVLENTHAVYQAPSGPCLSYAIRLADKSSRKARGALLHLLERGLVCAHPSLPDTAVRASFSERGLPDELDPHLWTELDAFLNSLQLESAPGVPAPRKSPTEHP